MRDIVFIPVASAVMTAITGAGLVIAIFVTHGHWPWTYAPVFPYVITLPLSMLFTFAMALSMIRLAYKAGAEKTCDKCSSPPRPPSGEVG